MGALDRAIETQLTNIEAETGRPRAILFAEVMGQGHAKHGPIRDT